VSRTGLERSSDPVAPPATGDAGGTNGDNAWAAPLVMLLNVGSRCVWTGDVCATACGAWPGATLWIAAGFATDVATGGRLDSTGARTVAAGCRCRSRDGFRGAAAPARRGCGSTAGLGAATSWIVLLAFVAFEAPRAPFV
jgi:hypothetical protein